ncbi:MAG: hypothetical protein AB7U61_07145 [Methylocystis sp.]
MGVLEFLKPKKGPAATQIPEMEAALDKLRAELKQVAAIVEGHGQRRADMLLSDAADADIAKLDSDVALAQIRLERLELAELELQDRIESARDGMDRSKRAAALERSAGEIEAKVAALDAAIGAVAAAYADLVKTVPGDSGVLLDADHMTRPATPDDIARAIVASGLFTAAPTLFEMVAPRHRTARPACVERILGVFVVNKHGVLSRFNPGLVGEECTIRPTAEAADAIIVSPLREQAARLRDSAPQAEAAE